MQDDNSPANVTQSGHKRALLIGVADPGPERPLDPGPSLELMSSVLAELGEWTVTRCAPRPTRTMILQALAQLTHTCGPADACVVYFYGHGGVVRFRGIEGPLSQRPVFYLAGFRSAEGESNQVLDVELTAALCRLDVICGNVTAIFDCCHSGALLIDETREEYIPTVPAPPWLAQIDPGGAAPWGPVPHDVVCIAAASSLRRAYSTQGHESVGLLTRCLADFIREVDGECARVTWDTVANRVKESVIAARPGSQQWVVFSGPRDRVMFRETNIEPLFSTPFIPDECSGFGWLRAGKLQGVMNADQWQIVAPVLDEAMRRKVLATARAVDVGLDHTYVVLDQPLSLPAGSSAVLADVRERVPVALGPGLGMLELQLSASSVLRAATASDPAGLRLSAEPRSDSLTLSEPSGTSLLSIKQSARMIQAIEARVRGQRLLETVQTLKRGAPQDLSFRWGWIDDLGAHEAPANTWLTLYVEDRLWLSVEHLGRSRHHWFVGVVDLGVAGAPLLVNTTEPDGFEVLPSQRIFVDCQRRETRQGMRLTWPSEVPATTPRQARLIVLCSQRPISLASIAPRRGYDPELWRLEHNQRSESTRGSTAPRPPPVLRATPAATGSCLEYELAPWRRPKPET